MAEFKQRLVRAKKQMLSLKKQLQEAADARDAALAEAAALRPPTGAAGEPSCPIPCRCQPVSMKKELHPASFNQKKDVSRLPLSAWTPTVNCQLLKSCLLLPFPLQSIPLIYPAVMKLRVSIFTYPSFTARAGLRAASTEGLLLGLPARERGILLERCSCPPMCE